MAYGIDILNSSGRTLFTTEEDYTTLTTSTPVSNANSGITLPTGTGTLIARPQNGESGVITRLAKTTGENAFFGWDTYQQTWGAAQGVKYAFLQKTSDQITTPTTTGYGFEVYESNGDVIFSSSSTRFASIEGYATVNFGQAVKYYNPNGGFNNLYVTVPFVSYLDNSYLEWYKIIAGTYVYFDHTEESITIVNNGNSSDSSGTQKYWDDWDYVSFFNSPINILIVRINGG